MINVDSSFLNLIQRKLLALTIENALQIDFYKEFYCNHLANLDSKSQLEELPLLYRRSVSSERFKHTSNGDQLLNEIVTGGTSGKPLRLYVGEREEKELELFQKELIGDRQGQLKVRGILFCDIDSVNSRNTFDPVRWHKANIYARGCFNWCCEVLHDNFLEPGVEQRCSIISGPSRMLLAFAEYVIKRKIEFEDGQISAVLSSGEYLSRFLRDRLQLAFKAPIIDRYGLSETVGGATLDIYTGWYFFDPYLIPEVVGYRSKEPLNSGIGVLLLTTLYPFQEVQPLIRYFTGDIVSVTYNSKIGENRIAIKPLGRATNGVSLENTDIWLITPDTLSNFLDGLDEIVHKRLFLDSREIEINRDLGPPSFRLSTNSIGSGGQVIIYVSLKKGCKVKDLEQKFWRYLESDCSKQYELIRMYCIQIGFKCVGF